jgi:hypothetical protein
MHAVGGGDPEHRRIAIGAARSVWQGFWGPGMDAVSTATVAQSCGIGMGSGLAGIAYALLTCARLLGEPSLLDVAIGVGLLVTEAHIAGDRRRVDDFRAAASRWSIAWSRRNGPRSDSRFEVCRDRY